MLESMSDSEFDAASRAAQEAREAAWKAAALRPRWGIGIPQERLAAQQAAWDAANPGLHEAAVAASDHADRLRDECDRRRRASDATSRAESFLGAVPRILELVRSGLKDTPATDAVKEWARTESWCLLLLGGVGCGKSTAAAAHALQCAKENPRHRLPIWARAVEASRMSAFGDTAEDRFATWREAPLLVMDDLGTELMTATWQQALDDVLDWRYQHSLMTILPSNLSADEFKKRYGDRISDRIREDGTVRQLDAKSMRRKS